MKIYYFITLFAILATNACSAQESKSSIPFTKSGDKGASIIFISGLACSSDVWNETVNDLKNTNTCYQLDIYNFTLDKKNGITKLEQIADAVVAFIENNKIQTPIIIGHSMGGAIALKVAADHPKLLSKLVIVDAFPSPSALMNPNFKAEKNKDCSGFVSQLSALTDEQFKQMQQMNVQQMTISSDRQNLILSWAMSYDKTLYASLLCNFLNFDYREQVKNIDSPLLVLVNSGTISIKSAVDNQYEGIKNCQLMYAEKGLHFLMFDNYEWYLANIKSFIK